MPEFWSTLLTLIVGAVVGQMIAPVIVARFSKTKQQKNIDLALQLSQVSEKTAAQLLQKLEQVDDLEKRVWDAEAGRAERVAQIAELQEQNEARESEIAALRAQIEKDTRETRELRVKYDELKTFTQNLIEALEKKGIKLPDLNGGPPDSIKGWRWDDPK